MPKASRSAYRTQMACWSCQPNPNEQKIWTKENEHEFTQTDTSNGNES
ncbi:MAG: hypothetical protein WBF90_22520 [Rivularia sp. (in: cyanobacteria)]